MFHKVKQVQVDTLLQTPSRMDPFSLGLLPLCSSKCLVFIWELASFPSFVLGWPKSSFGFKVQLKDTFFIFTKNFIEQCIHCFVPLLPAIFQATS